MEFRTRTLDHPDARRLNAALQQEYVRRYGSDDATPIDLSEFVAPRGTFIVGYLDGMAMACGGWRAHDPGPEFAVGTRRSNGCTDYSEIPRFGVYRCDARSRCFGKLLPVAAQQAH